MTTITTSTLIEIHNAVAMLVEIPTINSWKQAKSILIEKVETMKAVAIAKVKMVMTDSTDPVDPSSSRPIRGAIKAASLELLTSIDENGVGMSYDDILDRIRELHPTAKTSNACLRWYATKAKSLGIDMPDRPRKIKTVKASGKNIFKTIAAATA